MAMAKARNKRKRRRRSGRFGGILKLLVGFALAAAVIFGATVFFQVEEVAVAGNSRYDAQAVVEASGILQGDNLFRMNKGAIAKQILQQLPYVQSLSIQRVLPNRVLITVTEWAAVGSLEAEGKPWLVSVGGKLLETAEGAAPMTIVGITPLAPKVGTMLAVTQEEQPKLDALLKLLAALEGQSLLEKVSRIDMTDARYLYLRYEDRFDVKLELRSDFEYRLRALEAAIATRESYETGTMDLTQEESSVIFAIH